MGTVIHMFTSLRVPTMADLKALGVTLEEVEALSPKWAARIAEKDRNLTAK